MKIEVRDFEAEGKCTVWLSDAYGKARLMTSVGGREFCIVDLEVDEDSGKLCLYTHAGLDGKYFNCPEGATTIQVR